MSTDTHQTRDGQQGKGPCPICIEQFADKEATELSGGQVVCADCLQKDDNTSITELLRKERIKENQLLVSNRGLARILLLQRAQRQGLQAAPDTIFYTSKIQRGDFDKARILKFIANVTGGPRSYWVWIAEGDMVVDIAREWWKIKWNINPDEGTNDPSFFEPSFTHMGEVLGWCSPLTMSSGEVIQEKQSSWWGDITTSDV